MSTPGDLIAAAAIGGVAGEVAKAIYLGTVQPWIDQYFDRYLPAARRAAERNTIDFLATLSLRVQALEGAASQAQMVERVESALNDPDVAFTFHEAVLSGARTGSRARHELLAQIVAERLRATPNSSKAVASNQAVEVIKHLSTEHLEVLGLLALIHAVRPPGLIPLDLASPDEKSDWTDEAQKMAEAQAAAYAEWYREQRSLYQMPLSATDALFAHLGATGCVLFERSVLRSLTRALWPHRRPEVSDRNTPFFAALQRHLGITKYDFIDGSTRFSELWKRGLQHALPTPTGVLIGLAVHSQKCGQDFTQQWEWSPDLVGTDPIIRNQVWDGQRLDQRFLKALDKEIKDRAERGVPPWSALDQ